MLLSHDIPSAVLPLSAIIVRRDERQRREIITDDLELTMPKRGLIHPIVVKDLGDGTYELIAGERRFTAAGRIGWTSIPVRFADNLTRHEMRMIELEENIKRKDLLWQDKLSAIVSLHNAYLVDDPDWTRAQTAEVIGLSEGDISLFMTVADEIAERPELLEKKTAREAYNVVGRSNARKMGNALEELFQGVKAMGTEAEAEALDDAAQAERLAREAADSTKRESILCESFLEWAPAYAGPKFNLIHCDFPYGVGLFDKEFGQRGGAKPYEDKKETFFVLLDCLLANLDRLMSMSGHLVFWYSAKYDREIKDTFAARAPSLEFLTHPFIWNKSDNAGQIGDTRRDLRHTYETALVARRGARQVVKSISDCYSAPTDRALHPSTKPEPMLRHLFGALVDEHTSMLDPTCGSGSSLRAAESLGAELVIGLETDEDYCDAARVALRNARKLRVASAIL